MIPCNILHKSLFAVLLVSLLFCPARAERLPACLMQPAYISIAFPGAGLIDVFEREMEIPCKSIPAESWTVKSVNQEFLFVNADGPSGSGRYWTVTAGIGTEKQMGPGRGICLQTTTTGWRTLQQYKSPLVWNNDLNGDGKSELILWDSFPLKNDASPAEFGLIAWVYRLDDTASLKIDWALSRTLALDLSRSYRTELNKAEELLKQLRGRAGDALEDFGSGRCVAGEQN